MGWCHLTTLLCLCAYASAQTTCATSDVEPYVKFATKTAYEFVKDNSNRRYQAIPNCEPVLFWSLNRNAVNLPNEALMAQLPRLNDLKNNVVQNYDSGSARDTRTNMCRQDVDNLRSWSWNARHNISFAGDLTTQGFLDTQTLARNWKEKYPQILTNDPRDYLFKYVDDRISKESFQAFTAGLFGQDAERLPFPRENDEKTLRPQNHCSTWSKEVDKKNETFYQVKIFTGKNEFRDMVANVSARLGFSYTINDADVLRIYEMCRLNKAWDLIRPSPWCAAFTKEDLQRLEYQEDLKTYYKFGYGNPLNQKVGCQPIKDFMRFFSEYIDHSNAGRNVQPKAIVQMTKGELLLMTLSAMGAFRDSVPLTGDNYRTPLVQMRKWRASNIDPFGANLVAVLYRCSNEREQFKVMFFHNEKPLQLDPPCAVGLCDWSVVKERYGQVANECDMKFCNNSAGSLEKSLVAIVTGFALFLLTKF